MDSHPVVSGEQWLAARKALLEKEKAFSKLRDDLTQQRRELPWEKVDKPYEFDGPDGKESLACLFDGSSQLIVYHFMFDPDWEEGCKVCSMVGDHYDPLVIHLKHRDVSLVTVSRAPYQTLATFKQRMGWNFKWVSSLENDFNWDYHVSFTPEQMEAGLADYNYQLGTKFPSTECPGISSFYKDTSGQIFHTYSAYARGLENFLGIYNFLDIVSKGRDEDRLPYGMSWVRHHDRYDDESFVDPFIQ